MQTERRWMIGMVLGCICLVARVPAQDAEGPNPPDEVPVEKAGEQDREAEHRPEAPRRWLEQRDRISREATGPKTINLDRLERLMKRDLNLDAEQIEKIEAMFQERREQYRREIADQPKRMKKFNDRMGKLLAQMREARQRGDRKTEDKLSMEVLEIQEQARVVQIPDDFIAALQGHLREDQIEMFLKLAAGGRVGASLQEAARQRPELLRRFLANLGLDDHRRARLEELYRKVQQDMRTGKLDRRARLDLAREFYDQVMGVLSEQQKVLLLKHLGAGSRLADQAGQRSREPHGRADDRDHRRAADDEQGQQAGTSDAGGQAEYDP